MAKLTTRQKRSYYRKAQRIERYVREFIKRKQRSGDDLVVYGSRAINAFARKYSADYLSRHTSDFDIYAIDYREIDDELELYLDKRFGGDFFESTPARHAGTQKVKSRVTGDEIADFTHPDRPVEYVTIGGIRYAHPRNRLKDIQRSLADEGSRFRHQKDREAQQRILLLKAKMGKAWDREGRMAFNEED